MIKKLPEEKILFIHNAPTTFVRIDRDLLEQEFEIEELYLKKKTELSPLRIWKAVRRNDLVFGWFASWHTLLPFLFAKWQRKRSVLVAGGYDTANLLGASYGNQRHWFVRLITNTTIRLAEKIICNSNFTKKETMQVSGVPAERIEVVYHGLPAPVREVQSKKEKIVLNVGNVSQENLLRKGIQPFLAAAYLLPDYQFIQVGKWKDEVAGSLQKGLAPNAQLKGFVSDEELQDLYRRSKYYVQPSLHEGFGMSVVEAMQYGCIPIVSKEGALPEVIQKYGTLMDEPTAESIARCIRKEAINLLESNQIAAFVKESYTLAKRKEGLTRAIKKVCN